MTRIATSAECTYDPDGSYCYTHNIRNSEHDRELTLTRVQRENIKDAISGLIDNMLEEGFEFDTVKASIVPLYYGGWGMEVRAYKWDTANAKMSMYGVAVYMDERGQYEYDGA